MSRLTYKIVNSGVMTAETEENLEETSFKIKLRKFESFKMEILRVKSKDRKLGISKPLYIKEFNIFKMLRLRFVNKKMSFCKKQYLPFPPF